MKTPSPTPSPPPTTPPVALPRQTQAQINIERNHRTLPSSLSPTTYPAIPRFTPAVPSKMSSKYTPNNNSTSNNNLGSSSTAGSSNINNNNGYPFNRSGASSASSSPPGTPPSGLRNYYLQAAYQRSHLYTHGASTPPLQQPHRPSSISIVVPPQPIRLQTQEPLRPSVGQRSYSVDHLRVEEPEITITTPGGSNSTETESHVISLQRALSNLIENEGRGLVEEDEEEEEVQEKGSASTSTSSSPPGTPPHKKQKGVSKYPKINNPDRLDPEKMAATMESNGSEITLAAPAEEEEAAATAAVMIKDKKKSNRISKLFQRTLSDHQTYTQDQHQHPLQQQHQQQQQRTTDLTRQPSKAGVLSNLLKLQAGQGRPHQQHKVGGGRQKVVKEKKVKRCTLYSHSANTSTVSLNAKSVFATYPPLPPIAGATTTGAASQLSNFKPTARSNPNRQSMQFDNVFAMSFAGLSSPLQSPNVSPRGSFSGEITPTGGLYSGASTPGGTLSHEEKIRITIAVADILERQDYILRLAKSMIKYGYPSHRLEDTIDSSARILELNVQCVYLPNVMIVAFTDYETHTSETHLLKMPAGLDMYKCALVHQIHKMVTHSSMPVEEAIMKLEAIHTEKDANSRWLTVLAYAVASFCTAPMFFKGSWIDAGVSFVIGGAVGLLVWLSEKVPSYAHICEITMSVVVAFVAEALRHNNICQSAVKMAGIVIILPGYTITCAILELSSRHIISGSVRLFYAVVFSLLLGYGLTIGASIWQLFDHSDTGEENLTGVCPLPPLDPLWNILFVPLFAISLNIWIKAHPRQWFLATILSIVGYAVSYASSTYAGAQTEVSSALAAFAIGLLGNVYQRLTHQLTFQAVVCAVFFLVPGSMGLKGAMAWFTEDMTGGVNFALQMVITAIAISVGLFGSALVVYPMGKSRSAQMTF
ncbi:hypothetical protein EMPS_09140 [Entomortierella parvispora]|uniref:Threonine/serine exporter-like N-terminal domain-containing protein n=1 Tax=Entomortierella parvispora TaxID=205924 RepID=A0A9P3LZR6_9FUNG|nr:hypothetical protein EMPS_09140 [Entomortierella parvispora]